MPKRSSQRGHDADRPIILVSADQRELDGYTWHAVIDTYLLAALQAGDVSPLIVPAFGNAIVSPGLLDAASGVLLTGSRSNVHPARFGQEPSADFEPYDLARDDTTMALIQAALERDMPLLAICRGHQELNVAFGGTLETEIQTQPDKRDHRGGAEDAPKPVRFALNHTIAITPGGLLQGILDTQSLMVNSVHRQAIGVLGNGLTVEARADDGTIEAVSAQGKTFALGVQWHPEYWVSQPDIDDPASTQIFKAFGDAARAYRATRA